MALMDKLYLSSFWVFVFLGVLDLGLNKKKYQALPTRDASTSPKNGLFFWYKLNFLSLQFIFSLSIFVLFFGCNGDLIVINFTVLTSLGF